MFFGENLRFKLFANWLSQRLIRLSPRLIRPLADSGGALARYMLKPLQDEKGFL